MSLDCVVKNLQEVQSFYCLTTFSTSVFFLKKNIKSQDITQLQQEKKYLLLEFGTP